MQIFSTLLNICENKHFPEMIGINTSLKLTQLEQEMLIHIMKSSLIKQDQVFILEENNLNQELSLVWNAQRSFLLLLKEKTRRGFQSKHSANKNVFFFIHSSYGQQDSQSVEFWSEKIEKTWDGPIRNRLFTLGEPIWNPLLILGRLIRKHL